VNVSNTNSEQYDPQINALINQVWIRQHAWYETMSDAQRGSVFGVKIEKEIAAGVKLISEKMALIIPPTVPGLDNWRVEKTNARLAVSNEALVRQGQIRQAQMMINVSAPSSFLSQRLLTGYFADGHYATRSPCSGKRGGVAGSFWCSLSQPG